MNIFTIMFMMLAVIVLMFVFIMMTAPVSFPFFKAKTSNGVLIFHKTGSGKYVLSVGKENSSSIYVKKLGVLLNNKQATGNFARIPCYTTYDACAVPASPEAYKAAEKLSLADVPAFDELDITAEEAAELQIIDDYDVTALKAYTKAVAPEGVYRAVEQRAAEIFRANRNDFGTFMKWFTVVAAIAGFVLLAYMIMHNGSGAGVGAAAQQAAESVTNM